jgi:hypothetical protein
MKYSKFVPQVPTPPPPLGGFTITSERYAKSEQELMAYEMPITKIIEQNSVKDIEDIDPVKAMKAILK